MSRIEKALEKATMAREKRGRGPVPARRVAEVTIDVEGADPYITTLHEPNSPVSEEYRKLKSMVIKLTKHGGFKNTIMVTSSVSGEGKSITAANLAVALAQDYDHSALLIDADLRNPSLHRYFNIVPDAGLADCLADGLTIEAALLNIDSGNLSLLASGRKVKNPVDLLSSQRMKEMLGEMKHRYSDRYIIIDTPPVLPFAETISIASMADGAIFVVKEGAASVQNINDALDTLKDNNVFGIVYNSVSADNLYGHYNYYYNYGLPGKDEHGAI